MLFNKYISLSVFSVLLLACTENFTPNEELVEDKTVIIGELEVGKGVDIKITSTYDRDSRALTPTGENGEVFISNIDYQSYDRKVRWVDNEEQGKKWILNFPFDAGNTIELVTNFEDIGLGRTKSTCVVPHKAKVLEESSASHTLNNNAELEFIRIKLLVSELDQDQYHHFLPYVEDAQGNHIILDITDSFDPVQGIFLLSHTAGILIDYQSIDSNKEIIVDLKSQNLTHLNPSHIYLKLKTVNEEYYNFHKALTLQKESQTGPFDAVVPTVSNIEGGHGIFTAYQVDIQRLELE